jgi:hypothetical protein
MDFTLAETKRLNILATCLHELESRRTQIRRLHSQLIDFTNTLKTMDKPFSWFEDHTNLLFSDAYHVLNICYHETLCGFLGKQGILSSTQSLQHISFIALLHNSHPHWQYDEFRDAIHDIKMYGIEIFTILSNIGSKDAINIIKFFNNGVSDVDSFLFRFDIIIYKDNSLYGLIIADVMFELKNYLSSIDYQANILNQLLITNGGHLSDTVKDQLMNDVHYNLFNMFEGMEKVCKRKNLYWIFEQYIVGMFNEIQSKIASSVKEGTVFEFKDINSHLAHFPRLFYEVCQGQRRSLYAFRPNILWICIQLKWWSVSLNDSLIYKVCDLWQSFPETFQ